MLSAFAARKAAKEAKLTTVASQAQTFGPERPIESTPDPPPRSKRPSKRKTNSQNQTPNSPRKVKKTKADHGSDKKKRYFEENDTFQVQQDVIMIEPDESDTSELEEEVLFAPVPVVLKKTERAWSPSRPVPDSSDEEGADGDGEGGNGMAQQDVPLSLPEIPIPKLKEMPPDVLSTFSPIMDQNTFALTPEEASSLGLPVAAGQQAALLILSPTDRAALLGVYFLSVIQGSVSLCGTTVTASPTFHRIFASKSAPIPVIECVSEKADNRSTALVLPSRIQPFAKEGSAVIAISQLETGVEGLGRVCKVFESVFQPSRWQQYTHLTSDLPAVHLLTHNAKDIQQFILPASWEAVLASMSAFCVSEKEVSADLNPVVCLVRGPKKSGKTTFARTLLNRLLTRYQKVSFLECDLGQSEFTPGGMVALNVIEQPVFGPPFTHPTLPHLAHYIGSTTPRASPSHYLSAIEALLEAYRLDIQYSSLDGNSNDDRISAVIPLVVNTMGWTKGLGADLNFKIEEMVQPTDIFEIESAISDDKGWPMPPIIQHPSNAFQAPLAISAQRHTLEEIPPSVLSTQYNAIDQRNLSILSYFHAVFPPGPLPHLRQISAVSWSTELPLCARLPYEVDWTIAFDKIILTGAGMEDVVSSEIERVLNGAVVGLVRCDPGTIEVESSASSAGEPAATIPYTQNYPVPSPFTSNCLGLALIRAVSPSTSHMHVLSPIPTSLLTDARVVVKGDLELSIWGMLDFRSNDNSVAGVEKDKIPYLQWGKGEGIGGEKRRVRRNLMRKGQM